MDAVGLNELGMLMLQAWAMAVLSLSGALLAVLWLHPSFRVERTELPRAWVVRR